MVTVGGTEHTSPPSPPREPRPRGSILAAVGLGAGLALGALFTGGPPQEVSVPETVVSDPEASPTTTIVSTTTTDVVEPRLATLVPGMLDVLVASGIDLNGAPTVTVWEPAGRQPTRTALPWGDFSADASGSWLALFTSSRWREGLTLWVGNSAYLEPVSSDLVGQPVWHAWRPGNLAWIEATDNGRVLVASEFAPGRTAVPTIIGPLADDTSLVGWWETGFLTQTSTSLQVRDRSSTVVREIHDIHAVLGVGREHVAVLGADGSPVAFDTQLNSIGSPGWRSDCDRVVWSASGVAAVVLCGFGEERRFEYWADPLTIPEPLFVEAGRDFVEVGFTTNGLPFGVWIDPIRPTSTVVFYHPANGDVHLLDHPGRIQHLASVAG